MTEGGLARPGAPAEFGAAVQQRIAERGHAQVGDKTVLDALDASLSVLRGSRVGAVETLDAMVVAVDEAVERLTPERSVRGRASWLQERSIGLRDPGMIAYRTFLVELRSALAAGEQ